MKNKNILVNAIGIRDSGGITVLENYLLDILNYNSSNFTFICSSNKIVAKLSGQFSNYAHIEFIFIKNNSFLYRLYFENIHFRKIIKIKNISLIHNFTGSVQFFSTTPQLTKIQNLLFFSKKLDRTYLKNKKYIRWIKEIVIKRKILKFMLRFSNNIEIQSKHVKTCLLDYMNEDKKIFHIKSDINIMENSFTLPKKYNFENKIKFLFIVGPHFRFIHKNISDFSKAMTTLSALPVDFEINITVSKEELENSSQWNKSLNTRTNFIGYVYNKNEILNLFSDNTILISTSIIETLGLHVIEAVKNGILVISPNQPYSRSVYGESMLKYNLFNTDSLIEMIFKLINGDINHSNYIIQLQNDIKKSENSKYKKISEVFKEVI